MLAYGCTVMKYPPLFILILMSWSFHVKSREWGDVNICYPPNNQTSRKIKHPLVSKHTESSRWWFHVFFYVHPYLGKIPSLANILQMGWNHQPVIVWRIQADCESNIFKTHLVHHKCFSGSLGCSTALPGSTNKPACAAFIRHGLMHLMCLSGA